jgi:hypothetical protein
MKSRRRWAEHAASLGYVKNAYIFDGRPKRRRPFGRSKREDNIEVNLKQIRRRLWIGFIWYVGTHVLHT